MALTSTPSLNTDDGVTLREDSQLDTLADAPFQTSIDVLLPVLLVEVWLFLGEEEGVDTTVQVRVLAVVSSRAANNEKGAITYTRGGGIASDHEDGAAWSVFGDETGRFTTMGC